ncbi:MAG: ABC transporter permease [Phycisphaerales bacterium]|nr:ABC transporter permease [Phycisphaerales bacterium]
MNDMRIVLRSLSARRLTSAVTIGMVMVSVALLLVLLSLREAADQAFRRGTGNVHLLVSADASPLVAVLNGLFYANAPANPISWQKYQEVAGSFPWQWAIPTQLGDSFRGSPVMATDSAFLRDFEPVPGAPFRFSTGRAFEGEFEVVVGAHAAREHALHCGGKIVLNHGSSGSREGGHEHADHPYEVVGILQPTGSAHDRALFTNLESSWIIHAEDRLEQDGASESEADHDHDHDHDHGHIETADLADEDKLITGILLRLPTRPGSDASASIAPQMDRLRRDTSITVAQPAQQIGRLMAIVGDVDWLFVVMAVVVLVSSAISIMLAMVSSMELRRRQVAVLRVLGASAWRVFFLTITESTIIGVIGAILGAALAVVGCQVASAVLASRIGMVIGGVVDLRSASMVVAGAVVLSVLAGVLPAIKSYRTPVARHLRPIA